MATVKHFLQPEEAQYLAAAFPAYVKANGTNYPVSALAYDPTTSEKAYWKLKAANYGSGNVTVTLRWYAASGTTNAVVWAARLAAITPDTDTQDIETKGFAAAAQVTDTHLGTTAKRVHTCAITITGLDSLAADDDVWLEIARLPADAADTMAVDALLVEAEASYSDT